MKPKPKTKPKADRRNGQAVVPPPPVTLPAAATAEKLQSLREFAAVLTVGGEKVRFTCRLLADGERALVNSVMSRALPPLRAMTSEGVTEKSGPLPPPEYDLSAPGYALEKAQWEERGKCLAVFLGVTELRDGFQVPSGAEAWDDGALRGVAAAVLLRIDSDCVNGLFNVITTARLSELSLARVF